MKIAFYNPPASSPIIRRYMCSYNAGANLYPNIELLCLAAMARAAGHDVAYIDCVAEGFDTQSGVEAVARFGAEILVSLCGLECFMDDINELLALKQLLPKIAVGLTGYYPTLYPDRCLNMGFDFVLLGEGEIGLEAYLNGKRNSPGLATTPGQHEKPFRLSGPQYNTLTMPAHDLIKPHLYSELGLGSPLTVVQFTRGCFYPCNYCVRSYGRKTVRRHPDNVLAELQRIADLGIPFFRVLDDTFNSDKAWTEQVCRGILNNKIRLRWSALSRVDTLDEKLLRLMRRAGCRRLYIGIESGSQRILDYYKKGYKVEKIPSQVRQVRRSGLEAVGFFLLGAPIETWADVRQSIDLSKRCDLDYVIVTKLVVYPGTDLEKEIGHLAQVDPWSGTHSFADLHRERQILEWERKFYRSFYSSFCGIRTGIRTLFKDPLRTLRATCGVIRFLGGGEHQKKHPDYL